ncbi:MAG: CHAD domain-containing protein [Magnetospirillum sp. WYHS-4]
MNDHRPQALPILEQSAIDLASVPRWPSPGSVEDCFSATLRKGLDGLLRWEETAYSSDDIEGVHQMRVSARRMRSALPMFRPALPNAVTEPWALEMRWVGGWLGRARDLDVLVLRGLSDAIADPGHPGHGKLAALAEHHRRVARDTVRQRIKGSRYRRFTSGFVDWVDGRRWHEEDLSPVHRRMLEGAAADFARAVLERRMHQTLRTGERCGSYEPAAMHRLRLQCKKLRYAAEFFTPFFPGIEDFVRQTVDLQELLGVMSDIMVIERLTREMLRYEDDPDLLAYSTLLTARRLKRYRAAEAGFAQSWQELLGVPRPWRHAIPILAPEEAG